MSKGTVIYIGGFLLPDKNAAAHRVINNAKLFRELGYKVVFINKVREKSLGINIKKKVEYYGFECWDLYVKQSKVETLKDLYDISSIKLIFDEYSDLEFIIAYNFPSIALLKVRKYCRRKNIKCLGDITEWYGTKDKSLIYKIIKGFDTSLRMRIINKTLDGLIVISSYLMKYYKKQNNIICIPPLVDINDEKWKIKKRYRSDKITFVYAGSPSSEKERLDVIVSCISELSKDYQIFLNIIGITEEQFFSIYKIPIDSQLKIEPNTVKFHGRLNHKETIKFVKQADFTFVIRDDTRLTRAGFPTKFVESITCGTPVIATENSDLKKYIRNGINGYIVTIDKLKDNIVQIINYENKLKVEHDLFDYTKFIEPTKKFIEIILNN